MLEQRKHKRMSVVKETRALTRDRIAKVLDISKGGLSLMILDDIPSCITGELSLDLFCHEKDLDARQIPGKIVWDEEVSFSSEPGTVYKKVGVQFGTLSAAQRNQLQSLLFN